MSQTEIVEVPAAEPLAPSTEPAAGPTSTTASSISSKDKDPETEDLTLSPDDPSNTTITDAHWRALYTVKTIPGEHHSRTHTEVRNADGELLASLEWHHIRPDKVTFGDKPPISLGEWLHRSLLPLDS